MRILFVTSTRIGDAVLSTGLLDHLIDTCPGAEITIACGRVAEGVFARMPNRARTIVLDKRKFSLHWLGLWAEVARRRWDLVIDIRGSALSFLLRAKKRAVLRRRPGPKIAELGALLNLDPPPLPVAWMAPRDHARAATLLPGDRPVLALGPSANWAPKTWPAERFAALFRALTSGADAVPALAGAVPAVFAGPGATERAMATPLLAALPGAIDLVGRLSLPEVAACLRRAALFVGNDSGLMHLAAATGTPTLGLFGPTNAAEYAPSGRCAAAVIAQGVAQGRPARMEDLSVAAAEAAARALLAEPALVP